MRVLLDHCVPRSFGPAVAGHHVGTAREEGWDGLANGALLRAAAGKNYDVMITVDRNMQHQQSKSELAIPVVLLQARNNNIKSLRPLAPQVLQLLGQRLERRVYTVVPITPG